MTSSIPQPRFLPLAAPPRHRSGMLATLGLLALEAAMRLTHLKSLPIFCDEAIYLRWAQMIRAHPGHDGFIMLQDGRPPLHPWLLALVWPVAADPLMAGRLLSVLCGMISLLAMLGVAQELRRTMRPATTPAGYGQWLGWTAALLMIFCPYLAFHERLVLVEPLLEAEAMVAAWAALWLARAARETMARWWPPMLILGIAWGSALLTKQNFSYLIGLLPLLAALCVATSPQQQAAGDMKRCWRRWASGWSMAVIIAALLWLPHLLGPGESNLLTRLFYKPAFLTPSAGQGRWTQICSNLKTLFVPHAIAPTERLSTDQCWLWTYLTPPVYLLVSGSFLWMACRRQWRPLAFLGGWAMLILLPLALAAGPFYARYALLGIPPLLLAAAWAILDAACLAERHVGPSWTRGVASVLLLGVLAWPAENTLRQWKGPQAKLVASDSRQYVWSWSGGSATEQAIAFLRQRAAEGPLVLLTTPTIGTPEDAVWIYLQHTPNVQLRMVRSLGPPLLERGPYGGYLLAKEKWRKDPPTEMPLPPGPVYLIARDPIVTRSSVRWLGEWLAESHPHNRWIATFLNPPPAGETQPGDGVSIYLLNP